MIELTCIFLEAHAAMPTGTGTADIKQGPASGTDVCNSMVGEVRGGRGRLGTSVDVALGITRKGTGNKTAAFSPLLLMRLDPPVDRGWNSSTIQGSDMARGLCESNAV